MEATALVVVGVALAFFVGGIIKGAVGFGLPMVTVPLLVMIVDVRVGLALMTVVILATNFYQTFEGGLPGTMFRAYWWIFLAMAAGFAVGGALIVRLDPSLLVGFLGVVVAFFAAWSLARPSLALPERLHRPVGLAAGLLGGILGGLTTLFGPTILMYLLALHLPQERFIRLVGAIYLVGGVMLTVTYASTSILSWTLVLLSTICVVPALAGMAGGQWLRERVPQEVVRRITLVVLFLMGVSMVVRNVVL